MVDAYVSPARRYDFIIKLHPGEAKMVATTGYIERFTEEELVEMGEAITRELNRRQPQLERNNAADTA
jgi:hypothetical protein